MTSIPPNASEALKWRGIDHSMRCVSRTGDPCDCSMPLVRILDLERRLAIAKSALTAIADPKNPESQLQDMARARQALAEMEKPVIGSTQKV